MTFAGGRWAALVAAACGLVACVAPPEGATPVPTTIAPAPAEPTIGAGAIAGSWGLGSYFNESDRPQAEAAARAQCSKPYVIGRGPTGGVIMHLAGEPQPQELQVKPASGGRTFVGPEGDPGGEHDREIVSFDGKIMIMRWVDPQAAQRFGTLVFARCDQPAAKGRTARSKPQPKKTP